MNATVGTIVLSAVDASLSILSIITKHEHTSHWVNSAHNLGRLSLLRKDASLRVLTSVAFITNIGELCDVFSKLQFVVGLSIIWD